MFLYTMLMFLRLLHQFCAISNNNTQVTNKSYIVHQTLSVGVPTYYCMYIVLVADYYARWLETTYHVEFTVIRNRQRRQPASSMHKLYITIKMHNAHT